MPLEQYKATFEEGVREYLDGRWESARETLEFCNTVWPEDTPCRVLLDYMGGWDYRRAWSAAAREGCALRARASAVSPVQENVSDDLVSTGRSESIRELSHARTAPRVSPPALPPLAGRLWIGRGSESWSTSD